MKGGSDIIIEHMRPCGIALILACNRVACNLCSYCKVFDRSPWIWLKPNIQSRVPSISEAAHAPKAWVRVHVGKGKKYVDKECNGDVALMNKQVQDPSIGYHSVVHGVGIDSWLDKDKSDFKRAFLLILLRAQVECTMMASTRITSAGLNTSCSQYVDVHDCPMQMVYIVPKSPNHPQTSKSMMLHTFMLQLYRRMLLHPGTPASLTGRSQLLWC
jgi:hypothetical protein